MAGTVDPTLINQVALADFASFLQGKTPWESLTNPQAYITGIEKETGPGKSLSDYMAKAATMTNGNGQPLTTEQQANTARFLMLQQFIQDLGTKGQDAAQNILTKAWTEGGNSGVIKDDAYVGNPSAPATDTAGSTATGVMRKGSTITLASGVTVDTSGQTPQQVQREITAGGGLVAASGMDPSVQKQLDAIIAKNKSTSSGSTGPSHQQILNNSATFRAQLSSWGLDPSAYGDLINEAATKGWNMARLDAQVYQTPEFQKAFPGIFDASGQLKYSPAQYLQNAKMYQATAAQAGINLNDQTQAWLFRNDVTPQTFQARASADAQLRQNKDLFNAFGEELVRAGIEKTPPTKGQLTEFILGQGNAAWRQLWDSSAARYGAEQAGLGFGAAADRYQKVGNAAVQLAADQGLSPQDAQKAFQQVAQEMLQTMPFSKIQKAGLTHKDFVTATFGGKGSTEAQQKILRVNAAQKSFEESSGAHPQAYTTQGGQPGEVGTTQGERPATL
jgi:hypothetical protein